MFINGERITGYHVRTNCAPSLRRQAREEKKPASTNTPVLDRLWAGGTSRDVLLPVIPKQR
jgi:hypothetical protein